MTMPQGNESNESRSRLVKFNAPDEMLRELAGFAMLDNKPVNGVVNDAVSAVQHQPSLMNLQQLVSGLQLKLNLHPPHLNTNNT